MNSNIRSSREKNSITNARERQADKARNKRGDAIKPGGMSRVVGAATKDNRHGLHTDRSDSRRTESRRQGSMGRESKGKENRKNV